ncbi:flagella assembly cyclic-di-GMP phosphodiesterase TipF [Asticcacaulis taihuensis]|jgi:cyclic-di-GMP phosphodiesterase TipF (flagellum assembly factor)|uniref:Cyclic-di-GMP phosphodiesterase, flagellum assembly factor TipF n=1 Tax=Asticcacaulis taihuensis TaxID=260084 RepID=A0A1G4RVS0_9CAUL|nr:EAL domain-containing protein [Asticcacaulis taihuensis]SCW60817.1 cyclic-di-GMP phosphodiesterase, flagellum assembly factor TipF [Asticcacaulis taihuensis]
MGKFTPAILVLTYILVGLSLAAMVWNGGSDFGTALAVLAGTLGVCLSFHAYASQQLAERRILRDVENVRDAHRLMVDAIDSTQKDMLELADRVQNQRTSRSEELTSEVKMLEDLVMKLGESIEDRLNSWQAAPAATVVPLRGTPAMNAKEAQALALIETIREALIANRVDLYLQPVVSLPQRKTIFYESFSRLRDATGRVLMPAEYLNVADAEGLVPSIDNLLLFRCVQIVRRLAKQDRRIGIFCNISLTSLRDETFFPQFLEFLNENRDLAGSLIFELGQDAFATRGSVEARNMAKLADLGFRFSLDKVTSIDFDLQDLHRSDVRYVKIGANLLLEQLLEVEGKPAMKFLKDIHAGDYAGLLARYGIEVIAEKVESEKQVVDILDIEIGYAQGHLFGEPRAIKEQVLAETDPPAGFIKSTLPQQGRRRA